MALCREWQDARGTLASQSPHAKVKHQEYLDSLKFTKKEVDTSGEELARHALKQPHISKDKKRKIHNMLESGKFRKSEDVTDEKVVSEIDKYNDKEVKKAIASGRLPNPMKDKFYRDRVKRQASSNINKADPATRAEILSARDRLKQG